MDTVSAFKQHSKKHEDADVTSMTGNRHVKNGCLSKTV